VVINASNCYIVPGFVDVHVHGVAGDDTLDGQPAVARIAARLPRYGVTAFAPTTVACDPAALREFLRQVEHCRQSPADSSARVLPAHLESNFINPEYRGAQPAACLRSPAEALRAAATGARDDPFAAREILEVIAEMPAAVGIVTLAPELAGALDLTQLLIAAGHRVSLGHSGADYDTGVAAIEAGARHATHLFNRMPPLGHRAPGLAGAVLAREEIAAELICDGYHVHPAMCRMAVRAKGSHRVMAITDGTAASGLPAGAAARLGGRPIRAGSEAAFLEDGTLAGSTLTMDRAFGNLVAGCGFSVGEAAVLCATTPAVEMGLSRRGAIVAGAHADLVVLDRSFRVRHTFVDGREAYRASA
jgi:N-acetylglucosamine-6-phosphate deacetylase